jgi:16S rRNA processing protein RimM
LNKLDSQADSLVLIGRVSGAHGIQGEVKIRPYSGEPQGLLRYKCLRLAINGQVVAPVTYKVERARVHKDWAVVKLAGCVDRTQAEQLLHAAVHVDAEELPELAEDEFYLRDLEGRQVKTEDGQLIGRITGLLLGGAQDIAQVENNGQEYLIPLVPEFILALEEDAVIMSLPPGLLEINV